MAGQLHRVGQDEVAAQPAIVRDVHVGHDPVVVAQARDAGVLHGAGVDGDVLADGVAVADLQPRGLAGVLLVLRRGADAGEREEAVVPPDGGVAVDHAVRADLAAGADAHLRADHGVGTDLDRGVELGARIDQRSWMDLWHFNLETAVGCACQCRDRYARQGATTRRAGARKKEQRRMARRVRCWRVHSAFTWKVKAPKRRKLRVHAAFPRVASGQLRFLGSMVRRPQSRPCQRTPWPDLRRPLALPPPRGEGAQRLRGVQPTSRMVHMMAASQATSSPTVALQLKR